jgi:hypothetical protein
MNETTVTEIDIVTTLREMNARLSDTNNNLSWVSDFTKENNDYFTTNRIGIQIQREHDQERVNDYYRLYRGE